MYKSIKRHDFWAFEKVYVNDLQYTIFLLFLSATKTRKGFGCSTYEQTMCNRVIQKEFNYHVLKNKNSAKNKKEN